jgi:hypothetical protein
MHLGRGATWPKTLEDITAWTELALAASAAEQKPALAGDQPRNLPHVAGIAALGALSRCLSLAAEAASWPIDCRGK